MAARLAGLPFRHRLVLLGTGQAALLGDGLSLSPAVFDPGDNILCDQCANQVLGLSGGIGCVASAFALLQLCLKGPQHDDYLCPYEAGTAEMF